MPMQATATTPLFAAELTPHRSLSRKGLRVVMGLVALLGCIPALVFLSMGAWPIIGFMGLDVIAILVALHVSFQRGKRREQVTLWTDQLEWAQIDGKGARVLRRFNPNAVRLILDRDMHEKTRALRLKAGKEELEIGSFLNPEDKASFAKAFGTALRKARG